jgi:predicted acyl esterase
MGRYHSGYDTPSPLAEGKVYELDLDLWSSAIVFNKGHRIGLIVTSSSKVSYQVHPNTYEQVVSYDNSPVARNTIHCSAEYGTRLILPKVPVP